MSIAALGGVLVLFRRYLHSKCSGTDRGYLDECRCACGFRIKPWVLVWRSSSKAKSEASWQYQNSREPRAHVEVEGPVLERDDAQCPKRCTVQPLMVSRTTGQMGNSSTHNVLEQSLQARSRAFSSTRELLALLKHCFRVPIV